MVQDLPKEFPRQDMTSASSKIDPDTLEHLHEKLNLYMIKKRLRSTTQRRLVSDLFFQSKGHLSIEDLWTIAKTEDPKVGYATVYRTLKLLHECGLAHVLHFGDGVARYEIAFQNEHHDHLICTECNKIVEFEDPKIEELQVQLAERHGFRLSNHKHELYGICSDCREKV